MTRVYIDFETRSPADLKEVGLYRYMEHLRTEPICMAWALDNNPVRLWVRGDAAPISLLNLTQNPDVDFVAHNAKFDVLMWNKFFKGYFIDPRNVIDTQAKCLAFNIPDSLEKAAEFLGLEYKKATTGKLLIKRLSRPVSEDPLVWFENAKVLQDLYAYCRQDVEVLRAIDRAVPDLSEDERRVYVMDWAMNERGVKIDREMVAQGEALASAFKEDLDIQIQRLTNNEVTSCSEVKRITDWANARGGNIASLSKNLLATTLEGEVPQEVREVLELRQQYAKSSAAKLTKMLSSVNSDGRLRGQFLYHGAGTGRWSGRGVQLQNFVRLKGKKEDVLDTVQNIVSGDSKALSSTHGSPLNAIANTLRATLVPDHGKEFIGADLSSIEARIVAWISGQNDILNVFRRKEDVYCYVASHIYGKPITPEDKSERFIGKVATLALGYQGGVNAFTKMAKVYGVVVDEALAKNVVEKWRASNPAIVLYWREVNQQALNALQYPGSVFIAGTNEGKVKFVFKGKALSCELPSGRKIFYPHAVLKSKIVFGRTTKCISYKGELAGKTGLFDIDLYGGLFTENIAQGIARDVMVTGMLTLESLGYPVVMTVHDEVVCEVEKGSVNQEDFLREITRPPFWASSLPIHAETWKGERYLKT